MNYFNNNVVKIVALAIVLIILTIIFVAWEDYLRDHFVGAFDQYGLPSKMFRTGLPMMIDAWPLWLVPTIFIVLLIQVAVYFLKPTFNAKKQAQETSKMQQTVALAEAKGKSHTEFNRALEVESLKQQVTILKQKYFEEHHKSQDVARTIEEATLAMQLAQKEAAEAKAAAKAATAAAGKTSSPAAPSNAHNEAVITSLKADNKKLQKQITELQEDLEQSNALIEKLLETQGG